MLSPKTIHIGAMCAALFTSTVFLACYLTYHFLSTGVTRFAYPFRGFYGVLIAEEKLNVARDAARTAEADAKATRDRFEQGLIVD